MDKLLNPVVNNTQQVRASKIVLGSDCRTKIICLSTPVIRAIMYWTVSSVKLLNNVVVGTGRVYEIL